jgi:hypothetical protein
VLNVVDSLERSAKSPFLQATSAIEAAVGVARGSGKSLIAEPSDQNFRSAGPDRLRDRTLSPSHRLRSEGCFYGAGLANFICRSQPPLH